LRYVAIRCATMAHMSSPTSFRLDPELLARISEEAVHHGTTMTSLVAALLDEGLKLRRFPGIVFRDGPTGRRAALVSGPDVWEVVRAIRESDGEGEQRIRQVALDTEIAISAVQLAVDYACAFPDEIQRRIDLDEVAAERARRASEERNRLLSA
jgi:hypothetical protein